MNIKKSLYTNTIENLPPNGQHLLAQQDGDYIVFYQAYNHAIADYALAHQCLGGPHFNFNRMSWIKPNFLWMMFRCGWGEKENQERILAYWIKKYDFEAILDEAVYSTYNPEIYNSNEAWKAALGAKDVRLQWDPDHDPYGNKLQRRAIQIGLKGKFLENFSKHQIHQLDDITSFVHEQKHFVQTQHLDKLWVPVETPFYCTKESINEKIGIQKLQ